MFHSARGGELFEYINTEGQLEERVTVRLMHQILDGISFLHKNSIAHLDVKVKKALGLLFAKAFAYNLSNFNFF